MLVLGKKHVAFCHLTCNMVLHALEDCFQAMAMLAHNDFIFWHKREIAENIWCSNSTLLPFCPPLIIKIKQAILSKPPFWRLSFGWFFLHGSICTRTRSYAAIRRAKLDGCTQNLLLKNLRMWRKNRLLHIWYLLWMGHVIRSWCFVLISKTSNNCVKTYWPCSWRLYELFRESYITPVIYLSLLYIQNI